MIGQERDWNHIMPNPFKLLTVCLLALSACGPDTRQSCNTAAVKELRNLDQLIAETRSNLERGYALEQTARSGVGVSFCIGGGGSDVGVGLCLPGGNRGARTGPVAIDPAVERRKLATLEERRAEIGRQAAADLAACQTTEPET